MKSIPRKLLIHTVAQGYAPVNADGYGDKNTKKRTLYCVRVEPSSKLVKSKDNNELQLTSVMFYDCQNSMPRGVVFAQGNTIEFDGSTYHVETLDKIYDNRKLHHIELGLV